MNWRRTIKDNFSLMLFIGLAFVLMTAIGCLAVSRVLKVSGNRTVSLFLADTEKTLKSYFHDPEVAFSSIQIGVRNILDRGGNIDEVRDYLYQCNDFLVNQPQSVSGVYGIYGYFKGQLVDPLRRSVGRDFIIASRPWYALAMRSREAVYTSPYLDYNTGDMVLSLSRQVFGAKEAWYGVLSMDLGLKWLSEYTQALSEEGTLALIADREGRIVAHRNAAFLNRPLKDLGGGYEKLWADLAAGQAVFDRSLTEAGGGRFQVFFREMFNGWYIGAAVPWTVHYRDFLLTALVLAASGFILTLGLWLI
ncbi:MAG: cache domain-containing protein, partial [Deltaproteobacteria bacterium]|nr:cache domain-containing protein [Deltaproteobacteria bacterium]